MYLFLPLYKVITLRVRCASSLNDTFQRGNLQDAINANVVNRKHFSEQEMLRLFKGTCEAVRAMHDFRARKDAPQPSQPGGASRQQHQEEAPGRHSDDDERFPQPEGDGDGGYSYGSVNVPLVTKNRMEEDEDDVVFDGDEELNRLQQNVEAGIASGKTEVIPYAHRDLKPG